MTYTEAQQKSLTVLWETAPCGSTNCWCRMILPQEIILYKREGAAEEEAFAVAQAGEIPATYADYFVLLHNEKIRSGQESKRPESVALPDRGLRHASGKDAVLTTEAKIKDSAGSRNIFVKSKMLPNGNIYHYEERIVDIGYPDPGHYVYEWNRYEKRSTWLATLLLGKIRYELINGREVRQSI